MTPGDQSQGLSQDQTQGQSPRETFRDLERQFDRLGSARDKARDDEASAQELRERAQEMLEKMSPEERKEMLDRWSAAQRDRQVREVLEDPALRPVDPAQDQQFDRVDMSRPDKEATDRVIARWLSEGEGDPNAPPLPDFSGTVRQSRESAEKAFEQQRIPRRHQDLVRRVFDRLAERASPEKASDKPGSNSPGAENAGSGGN